MDKGLDASKKVLYKAGKFIENKIADTVNNLNNDNIEKQEPDEKIIIPSKKRQDILNELRKLF